MDRNSDPSSTLEQVTRDKHLAIYLQRVPRSRGKHGSFLSPDARRGGGGEKRYGPRDCDRRASSGSAQSPSLMELAQVISDCEAGRTDRRTRG